MGGFAATYACDNKIFFEVEKNGRFFAFTRVLKI